MTTVNSTAMPFDGRTVVVTGGAGGIGRAVCEGFAQAGARTLAFDLAEPDTDAADHADPGQAEAPAAGSSPPPTERAPGDCATGGFGHDAVYSVDVTDEAALAEAFADVHSRYGGPHVLVTLAGGSLGTPRDLDAFTGEQFTTVLDVNVTGTLHACRTALPYLRDTRGSIVTCASIGARQPSPVTGVPYATAKAAIGGLTRRLATETGPDGVRVNAVAPGLFLTPRLSDMFTGLSEPERSAVTDAIALRRMPQLREIVDPILFLASDAAAYITGITLDVNGGRFMPL